MLHIQHPRPELGRVEAFGLEFIDGTARVEELHPERELALRQHGFTVETFIDLTTLSKKDLLDIAETEGIAVPSKATKEEIVDILAARPAQPIPGSVDNGDGSFTAPGRQD
ncbi:hypothetical protein GCM10009775_04650 [Microbacterium aoyamense]|uniref:Rho termination factor N-terminal domain-containing protein n=1 Tax=Microbacterium aoyamense TaxID=344166 RepID=A0ABP5AIV6_9MICO|nr:Rho termination factor N-terminal domain-containing protein [Microbacterium aoyamense]